MSKRAWEKRAKLRRSEAKRNREIIVPFGAVEAPNGAPLQVTSCLSCGKHTTELWTLITGKVGCGQCVRDRSLVLLAVCQEEQLEPSDAPPRVHLISPSEPLSEAE
ncbi:MAG: hypothetical protein EBT03_09270 [Betaproteobacteria bacterium]|nr:hypothetical protein [Betaproteobacteria bacterium]